MIFGLLDYELSIPRTTPEFLLPYQFRVRQPETLPGNSTNRSFATAFPSAQFFSGLILPSIEAWTIGMLVNSSPNIKRKGTNTP